MYLLLLVETQKTRRELVSPSIYLVVIADIFTNIRQFVRCIWSSCGWAECHNNAKKTSPKHYLYRVFGGYQDLNDQGENQPDAWVSHDLYLKQHLADNCIPELGAFKQGGMVHRLMEIVGYGLGRNDALHPYDDQVRGLIPAHVT